MDSAVAVVDARTDIEALYRADGDRLWRAIYAFAGDAEIASDPSPRRMRKSCTVERPSVTRGLGVARRVPYLARGAEGAPTTSHLDVLDHSASMPIPTLWPPYAGFPMASARPCPLLLRRPPDPPDRRPAGHEQPGCAGQPEPRPAPTRQLLGDHDVTSAPIRHSRPRSPCPICGTRSSGARRPRSPSG